MRRWWVWGLVGLGAIGLGAAAFVWFTGGSGQPSTDITAPPLTTTTTATIATTDPGETTTSGGAAAGTILFEIMTGESVAAFEIDEELRGQPNHVVGTTGEVAGQIRVDLDDASSSQIGTILVNARTFATDSSFRDRAIRGPIILNSAENDFEFISFEPTAVDGLTGPLEQGEPSTFTVTGDLTIRGTTAPVTFDVTATLVSADRLEGTASATVLRSQFGIGIPNAPGVANVSDEVLIRLDFVAAPA